MRLRGRSISDADEIEEAITIEDETNDYVPASHLTQVQRRTRTSSSRLATEHLVRDTHEATRRAPPLLGASHTLSPIPRARRSPARSLPRCQRRVAYRHN